MQKKQNTKQQKSSALKVSNALGASKGNSHGASQALLSKAYSLHQAGNLTLAKATYLQALKLSPRYFDALQLMGTLCAQLHESAQALQYFDQAIEVNASNASVYNNRGMVLMDLKNPSLALNSYDQAIRLQPNYPEAHANKGNAWIALNELRFAVQSYEHAIALRPEFADTYNNLGVVLLRIGELGYAIKRFAQSAVINPSFAQAYYNSARAYKNLGDLRKALEYYNKAIALNSQYLDAYNNRGNILLELKDYTSALESFDQALGFNANAPQIHNNKGNVYKELKRFDEAVRSYKTAIQIYPQYADAHNNLGNVFQELKLFNDALICYDQALTYNPQFVDALNNKGVVLRELKQTRLAVECYGQALLLNPQFAQGYFNLGNALKELDMPEVALIYYTRALSIDSSYNGAKWAVALINVPTFIHSVEHLEASRVKLSEALAKLGAQCSDPRFMSAYQSIGLHQPFYLAYQERNNRELMLQYAAICHKVMSEWESRWRQQREGAQHHQVSASSMGQKIKLGIISDQIRYHSVWNAITKGLVEHLNPEQFEIHIFYLGTLSDEQTAFAKSRASTFTQNLPSLKDWANAVLDSKLDAILYPEIGMHALTLQLAHLRLAPLQMVSWGHPETTGIETIDYFISAEEFEDKASVSAYSEKLLTLPGLGCTYDPLQIKSETVDLTPQGVQAQRIKLLCPGTVFKYSPEYDWTFVQIAKKLNSQNQPQQINSNAHPYQFVFLYREAASAELLKARLQKAFLTEGLDLAQWSVFIPWMSPQAFYGLMHQADLFLDTLGFSGFNTAMQAVECGLPIITLEGRFLRGRFASGILKRISMKECIASTAQEYVDKVVQLASNAADREAVRAKLRAQRNTLFKDLNPVREFEKFLIAKCKHSN